MAIDIRPDSDTNAVNLLSRGVIPVAILGSDTFDVADVDVMTLACGPDAAASSHDLTKVFGSGGGCYDTVCDLPVPLVLPVAGQVASAAA